MSIAPRIIIIGVGNEFRHDGVGWAVIARLKERTAARHRPSAMTA